MKKLTINPDRIGHDEAYLLMAEISGKRSKANRLQVGAMIVNRDQLVSDGYNGMPSGLEGDDEVCEEYVMPEDYDGRDGIGGPPDPEIRTKKMLLHAEANAILKAARYGRTPLEGSTLYTTYSPCPDCAKLIGQAKIKRVVFRWHYRLPEGVEMLEKLGIPCDQVNPDGREPPKVSQSTCDRQPEPEDSVTTSPWDALLWPSEHLAEVLGSQEPIKRMDVTKQVWEYIKRRGLQDDDDKRTIHCDPELKAIMGKWQIDMFEMTKKVNKHLFDEPPAHVALPKKRAKKNKA